MPGLPDNPAGLYVVADVPSNHAEMRVMRDESAVIFDLDVISRQILRTALGHVVHLCSHDSLLNRHDRVTFDSDSRHSKVEGVGVYASMRILVIAVP